MLLTEKQVSAITVGFMKVTVNGVPAMLIKFKSIFSILSTLFLLVIIPDDAHTGFFKKPWSNLEVDYLAETVSPGLGYFDGRWSGSMECGRVENFKGFTTHRYFVLEQGAGIFETGVKGNNGYRQWKIKIKRTGKVTVKGKYVQGGLKYISFSGQIGVDPKDPYKEIMWIRGTRGPRTCESKLYRQLPSTALKVLSGKLPALAEILHLRDELKKEKVARKKIQDTTPPEIKILTHDTSRAINVLKRNKKIKIKGMAKDENGIVEVLVNNKDANLDKTGNFEIDIYLGIGNNDIVITAMDTFENMSSKRFTVTREASMVPAGANDFSERNYALIIGNDNYMFIRKLENAKNDAREIAYSLKTVYGFETILLFDATRHDIIQAINDLRKDLKENDNLLIYYAGHGRFDKTVNKAYWLPVDARSDDDTNWILADRISSNMRRISSKHILLVADSCYSGTLTRSAATDFTADQSRDHYLHKMRVKNSRTLMASGGNEPVSDAGGKGHSVFAASFLHGLNEMEKNTFTAEELYYEHIKERVAGNADQTPEYNIIRNSGHDGGDFIFMRIR